MSKINSEINVVGSLSKAADIAQECRRERDGARAALEKTREELSRAEQELVEKTKAWEGLRSSLERSVESVAKGEGKNELQAPLARHALWMLKTMAEASRSMRAMRDAEASHGSTVMQILTAKMVHMMTLLQLLKKKSEDQQQEVPSVVVEAIEKTRLSLLTELRKEMSAALDRIDWTSDQFTRPLVWHDVSTLLQWLLSLETTRPANALMPLWEPFKKRFVFHFIEQPATSKPEILAEAVKTTLKWIDGRNDFLVSKVQPVLNALREQEDEDDAEEVVVAVVEFVREMSILLTHRVRRDLESLIRSNMSGTDAAKNKVFLDECDELFAWSLLLQSHYAYALSDATLHHSLLRALLPAEKGSPVTSYWLALERASLMSELDDALSLEPVEQRTRHRLSLLPLPWQRRLFFSSVHIPCVERIVKDLVRLDDSSLENSIDQRRLEYAVSWFSTMDKLHSVGEALVDWSMRPEYDQDEGFLERTGNSCLERIEQDVRRLLVLLSSDFLGDLEPWLGIKNWLFVHEDTAKHLASAANNRLDMSPELCAPFERLREWMRQAALQLKPTLFASMALHLAEVLDREIINLLLDKYTPDMSMELARQFEYDLTTLAGIWLSVVSEPKKLFKRLMEASAVFMLSLNEITAINSIKVLGEPEQLLILQERFRLFNLTPKQALGLAQLRKDE